MKGYSEERRDTKKKDREKAAIKEEEGTARGYSELNGWQEHSMGLDKKKTV